MEIESSLLTALMLLGLGMAFVYLFLGLLFICITLMAKYIPADPIVTATPYKKQAATADAQATVSPQVLAAITSAVKQYRKKSMA